MGILGIGSSGRMSRRWEKIMKLMVFFRFLIDFIKVFYLLKSHFRKKKLLETHFQGRRVLGFPHWKKAGKLSLSWRRQCFFSLIWTQCEASMSSFREIMYRTWWRSSRRKRKQKRPFLMKPRKTRFSPQEAWRKLKGIVSSRPMPGVPCLLGEKSNS